MNDWSGAADAFDSHLPQFVQGVGVAIVFAHLLLYVAAVESPRATTSVEGFLVGAATVYPFAAATVYGGRRLQRGDLPREHYGRIRNWFLGGLVGFLALNLAMIATWPAGSVFNNVGWALFAAAVGGAMGLGVGLMEARRIWQAVRADRQRQRRREIEARNERLADFAESVAHDLRNPLNVAAGNLELARREPKERYFANIESAHDRMATLIDQSLRLARSGREIDELESVELTTFAERCWSNVPTDDARLDLGAPTTIDADPERLTQLLENLFRNAVEHSSESPSSMSGARAGGDSDGRGDDGDFYRGAASAAPNAGVDAGEGTGAGDEADASAADEGAGSDADASAADEVSEKRGVTVSVGPLPDGAGFYVADDGPGIPEAERSKVLESGYSQSDDGSGLGLAIVSRIADAHGWSVEISESDTGGARFEFHVTEDE
ncbi:sensor histidine kinase [Halobellus rubicundus]|uniref:histidine kinase n=1 Tax=Halobellus rubicundus TaxID=2996466 RepID=A0ABD5MG50_9EURY